MSDSSPHPLSGIERARLWTPIDEDLDDVDVETRRVIRSARIEISAIDLPRSECWTQPGGLTQVVDVPYVCDGDKGHLLDVYFPEQDVLDPPPGYPVFIDIHGGAFIYGSKELNKNFCLALAVRGFVVFSLNYRLAPVATFSDQVRDVGRALQWIDSHLTDFPANRDAVFLMGDSAGACLGLLALTALRSDIHAEVLGFPKPNLEVAGAAFISGLFDLSPLIDENIISFAPYLDHISSHFFDGVFRSLPSEFRSGIELARQVQLPPMYLCTSSDDFLDQDSLRLADACASVGGRTQLVSWRASSERPLGHVFPVGLTWLPESQAVLDQIVAFASRRGK